MRGMTEGGEVREGEERGGVAIGDIIHACAGMYVCMCVCIYIHIYITCVCVTVCVCVCTYTHIYSNLVRGGGEA